MTATVERTYQVDADCEAIWELIADPAVRAEGISIVDRYHADGDEMVWHLHLPVRMLPGTITVRTRDLERDPPNYVKFEGRSRVMRVEGEHELETMSEGGCSIRNRFVVDGRVPGVEGYFKRHIDDEIEGLIRAIATRIAQDESA